jgi:hypothetical protein
MAQLEKPLPNPEGHDVRRDPVVSASNSDARPPSYHAEDQQPPNQIPPDLSGRLRNLNLNQPAHVYTPIPDQLIAHLKLLDAFWKLKEEVGKWDGLFDIQDPTGELAEDPAARAKVCEKRWAVYVARAVDRFEAWWTRCVPHSKGGRGCGKLRLDNLTTDKTIHLVASEGRPLGYLMDRNHLPPLGKLLPMIQGLIGILVSYLQT